MDRKSLESLDREGLIGIVLMQVEAMGRLTEEMTKLRAENAELRAQLGKPPKTPDNSSVPPSRGQKPAIWAKDRPKKHPHPGAHRPLHPNPTQKRDILANVCGLCGADVSKSPQAPCEVYDRIEIPPIAPEITRVSLHGGVCPCCAR